MKQAWLTDKAWTRLAPLLPGNRRRGGRWRDHRTVINGILPWTTCYGRLVRWRRDGSWDRLLAHAQTKSDAVGELEWIVSVDSTSVRAHQHAAGARHHPARGGIKGASVTRPRRSAGPAAG